ncbi:hypothetical protein ACVIHH_000052 [Bradyrhizobium sp. USDA 4518]
MSWTVGPLGSTRPRSYLSNALGPPRKTAPALRCDRPSLVRTLRIVSSSPAKGLGEAQKIIGVWGVSRRM